MKNIFKNLIIFLALLMSANCAFCYTLTPGGLDKIIQNKIKSEIKFDDFKLKISGIPQENIITSDANIPKVEIISQNSLNSTFQPYSFKKVVVKDSQNNIIKTFSINVQTFVYKNVLVAKEQIAFNGEINSQNTTVERKEVSRYLNKTFSNVPDDLIASRNYPKGAIILSDGAKRKAVMLKNSTIDIIFLSKKGLRITVQGRALKDGAVGETILVKSDKYNKTYNAVVNSNREAEVRI